MLYRASFFIYDSSTLKNILKGDNMSQTSEFQINDFVYCMVEGREGVVSHCDNRGEYPIGVIFGEGDKSYMRRYTSSGQYLGHGGVTLFHEKPEIIVPEKKPEPRFKPGTPLVVVHNKKRTVYWFIAGEESDRRVADLFGIRDANSMGLFPYAEYTFHVVGNSYACFAIERE